MVETNKTDRILNDIRSYLRMSAAAASRPIASKVIDTQEKAIVYSKLDGKTSQQKISDVTKVAQKTISNWDEEFVRAGLAMPPDEYYPSHRALFSLAELDINVSVLKKREKDVQPPPATQTLDESVPQRKLEGT